MMKSTTNAPKICLLTTGGTISMVSNSKGILVPNHEGTNLMEVVPALKQIAQVTTFSLGEFDSANAQPAYWETLAQAVYERYHDFDGFVIAHGTDTLAYSAAALSFCLQELGKPIVLTGAQIPISQVGSDGAGNLISAFRVAVSDLSEVCVVFGTVIIRGTKARKTSAFDLNAFQSINTPPIGRIGLRIDLSDDRVKRADRKPILNTRLDSSAAMIMVYPGIRPDYLEYVGSSHRGIVLLGYGVGSLPSEGDAMSLIPAIRKLVKAGVAIVIGTQCTMGSTELGLYEINQKLSDAGAIPARDMTPETSLVKLMWVLGQTQDIRTIESMMLKNFVGEISPAAAE